MLPGQLWNHNGAHAISLSSVDNKAGNSLDTSSTGSAKVATLQVNVANLVITNVSTSNGTSDYFRFDPESDEVALRNPKVTFSIQDGGEKNRYQWYLWVKPTRDEKNHIELTGIMSTSGTKTVTINADPSVQKANGYSQSHNLTQWGTYTFDLRIIEIKNNNEASIGEPPVDFRSTNINMSSHSFEYISDEKAEFAVRANYVVDSDKNASEVRMNFLDSNLSNKAINVSGPKEIGAHNGVEIYHMLDSDPSGTYIGVFTAVDNHASYYRDHKTKKMLAINQRTGTGTQFNIWYDAETWHRVAPLIPAGGQIDNSFRQIGINPVWQGNTAGPPAEGIYRTIRGWQCNFRLLSEKQRALPGVAGNENVILLEYQGPAKGRAVDGVLGQFCTYANGNWLLRPANPGLAAINTEAIRDIYTGQGNGEAVEGLDPPLSGTQLSWLHHNAILHELSHSLARGNHCGDWYVQDWHRDRPTQTCILHETPTRHWDANLRLSQNVYRNNGGVIAAVQSPWHSMWEINQMRWQLGLPSWKGIGIYTHLVAPDMMEAFH